MPVVAPAHEMTVYDPPAPIVVPATISRMNKMHNNIIQTLHNQNKAIKEQNIRFHRMEDQQAEGERSSHRDILGFKKQEGFWTKAPN
jgi:hypothetical protein